MKKKTRVTIFDTNAIYISGEILTKVLTSSYDPHM
jgi:hypothetical protein